MERDPGAHARSRSPDVEIESEATDVVDRAIDNLLQDEWDEAEELLLAEESICATEELSYSVEPEHGEEHYAACHLYRSDTDRRKPFSVIADSVVSDHRDTGTTIRLRSRPTGETDGNPPDLSEPFFPTRHDSERMERILSDDFHDLDTVADPRLSPDGSRVAYVRKTPDGDDGYRSVIETVPVDGKPGDCERFTMPAESDSQPQWSPSGDRLAFVSTRGEGDRPQLWIAPTGGGEARRVTDVPGGVAGVTWRPDGSQLAFVQETTATEREEGDDRGMGEEYEPEDRDPHVIDRLVYRMEAAYRTARSWETFFGSARSHVYVVDLDADDEVHRVTDGDRDHFGLSWGGNDLYYLAHVGDDDSITYDVERYDPDARATRTVTRTYIHPGLTMRTVAATSDGRVAYPTDPDERRMSQTDVAVYDPDTGEETVLTDGLDRKAAHTPLFAWGPDEESLYFTVPDEGRTVVYRAAGDGEGEPERAFVGTDVNGADVSTSSIVVTMSEWDHPGDVFVGDPGSPATGPRRLTRVNADFLDEHAVREPEEVWFSTEDGPDVQGWVLTPPDFDPEETYPLAVEVHGGPVVMWTTTGTMWHEFQTLANAGYVVFWSNPRGSIGYGEAFTRAVEADWGGPYFQDLMAGVDEVTARNYVDEDNAFVTGGSYGGYMTAWTIGQTDRFRAANPQRGVYDLKTMYGTSSVANLLEYMYGGVMPWDDPEKYWAHSPIAYVEEVDTPTLIFQSEYDYNTPAADSEMYYRFLKKQGVDVRMIYYPREGHELSRSGEPEHVVDRLDRLLAWFDGHGDHSDAEPPVGSRE